MEKFIPSFTPEYFKSLLREVGAEQLYGEVERVIFDPKYMAKRVVLDEGKDLVQASANHYYEGVTQEEVEKFYGKKKKEDASKAFLLSFKQSLLFNPPYKSINLFNIRFIHSP